MHGHASFQHDDPNHFDTSRDLSLHFILFCVLMWMGTAHSYYHPIAVKPGEDDKNLIKKTQQSKTQQNHGHKINAIPSQYTILYYIPWDILLNSRWWHQLEALDCRALDDWKIRNQCRFWICVPVCARTVPHNNKVTMMTPWWPHSIEVFWRHCLCVRWLHRWPVVSFKDGQ